MKKIVVVLFVLGGFGLWMFSSSGTDVESTTVLLSNGEVSDSRLRYFGFAITDCLFDDPTTKKVESDYVSEVARFSNVIHLCAFEPTTNITAQLERYEALNVQALLYIEFILFSHEPVAGMSGTKISLRPDYKERLQHFIEVNDLENYQDQILALYVVDEPYWNRLETETLNEITDYIETVLPDLQQFTVFAYPSVKNSIAIPKKIDLVGYDRYGVFEPHTDASYMADIEKLADAMSNKQAIVLVFESMWNPDYSRYGFAKSELKDMFKSYLRLAREREYIVGMIGYPWPNGFDGSGFIGARDLDALHQLYQEAFDSIGNSQ